MLSTIRSRYGAKLGLAYIATGGLLVAVGLATNDVASTVVAGIAGLLALGSINAAESVASIKEISGQTASVADGNLDKPVVSTRTDEFGELAASVEAMRRSLRARVQEMEST